MLTYRRMKRFCNIFYYD